MNLEELKAVCAALNILIWKVSYDNNFDATPWAAALQDRKIMVEWDEENNKFRPKRLYQASEEVR